MKKFFASLVALAFVAFPTSALAEEHRVEGPNGEHLVVVCKYVGTPHVDEQLQTGNNPIVVDSQTLENRGGIFEGFAHATNYFEFYDEQGKSIAIRWATDSQDGSIEECPEGRTPDVLTPVANVTTECVYKGDENEDFPVGEGGVLNVHVGIRSDENAEGKLWFTIYVEGGPYGYYERGADISVGEADEVETFSYVEGNVHVLVYAIPGTPGLHGLGDLVLDETVTVDCDLPDPSPTPPSGSGDNPPVPTEVPMPDEPDIVPDVDVVEPTGDSGTGTGALPFTGTGGELVIWSAAALALIALGYTFLRRSA